MDSGALIGGAFTGTSLRAFSGDHTAVCVL